MGPIDKVLVVEDDETSRFIANSILKRMGLGKQILMANNGLEALNLLKDVCNQGSCPELILIDIKMPVMDGFELLMALNKSQEVDISNSKIILLTSSASPKDIERAESYPFTTYMHKPLTKEKLQELMAD